MAIKILKHKPYVVDSSVILNSFLDESTSPETVDYLLKYHHSREIALFAPSILVYEVGNTLTREFRDLPEFEEAINRFYDLDIGIVPLDYLGMQSVAKMVQKYPKISYYDAAFHILAKELNAIFITADRKYYNQVKDEGFIYLYDDIEI